MSAARPAVWQLVALACYGLTLALVIPRHEPWFDEAQAWLLARDAPLVELFSTWLRYEGNPGLWHLLLAAPAKLGAPYATMHALSAALAFSAAALCILRAPFPPVLRVAIPFSYFPLFQYGVVARPYALAAPALFALAALWPKRMERPRALAACLALLACVSVPGTLIAGTIAALHLLALRRDRAALGPKRVREHAIAQALLLALGVAIVLVLLPPADHAAIPAALETDPRAVLASAWAQLNGAFTELAPATLVALALSLTWLRARGMLALFAMPAAVMLAFGGIAHAHPWHEGMLFLLWVFALWVSWPRGDEGRPKLLLAAHAGAALVLAFHISWSLSALRFDWTKAYSAGRDVAAHLREHAAERDRVFATGYGTFAIQPYFPANRFDNYRSRAAPAFFDWRRDSPLASDYAEILRTRPELVVVGVKYAEDEALLTHPQQLFPGYEPRVFLGALWWKNRPLEWEACVVYQRRTGRGEKR